MNAICRKSTIYPYKRVEIPDDKVPWSVSWPSYKPTYYSAEILLLCRWADPPIGDKDFNPKWNDKDGGIDRSSYDYNEPIKYDVVDNHPLNIRGRTGLGGRGRLGRWGPNHAADAVVTRWKRRADKSRALDLLTGKPILQVLFILRKDCKKWAIPGGFLNAYEESSSATLRELFEEAVNMENLSDSKKSVLNDFFKNGKQVYKGYVDDPRNTDNAWIETTASNFHDENGEYTKNLVLEARDDAASVKWFDIVKDMEIYESHRAIIEIVNDLHLSSCKIPS